MAEDLQDHEGEPLERIAIVGMACRVPGAADVGAFWRNLLGGVESLHQADGGPDAPEGYVPATGKLDGVEEFDAEFFGIPPREAELMDPQHRLFLEQCQAALDDANYGSGRPGERAGVFGGCGFNAYMLLNLAPHYSRGQLLSEYPAALLHGNDKDYLTTRVAYRLGLTGPAVTVQTACSSSLVAVAQACQSLLDYQSDFALAGGVSVKLPQDWGYVYEAGGIQSADGHCRPFDADASGTVFGSGVGVVALKRLSDALEHGDRIHAVILGTGVNNDGAARAGYTAPSVDGQAEAIAAAYREAEVSPLTVGYVEAHGTGTAVGDPIEIAALDTVFGAEGATPDSVLIGSVKSNIGHLNAASGVIGLVKSVLAVREGQLPPSLHYHRRNPRVAEKSAFAVNDRLRAWPEQDGPRRAAVSSFGVGGTNVHLVLEQPPAEETSERHARRHQVLTVSARTAPALEQARAELLGVLAEAGPGDLPDIAHTLQLGRRRHPLRLSAVGATPEQAAAALAAAPARQAAEGSPVAFLFPGQGSQFRGMAADLLATEPRFASVVRECVEILNPLLGVDLLELLATPAPPGTPDPLTDTALAQPALFTVEYALAQWWRGIGVEPSAMLGHSIGEWVAACLAGVFELPDALRLVAARGRLMAGLPSGAMLAVELSEAQAAALEGPELSLAAVNAPDRCVLSGTHEAIAAAEARLAADGRSTQRLHTSHAFHSAMLDPIVEQFAELVAQVPRKEPRIPFLSNVTGTWIGAADATDPRYWARQARGAVRFADGLAALVTGERPALLEVGPGRSLGRLVAQTAGPGVAVAQAMPHAKEEIPSDAVLLAAAGRLWEAGVALDWTAFAAEEERRPTGLPGYPFQRRRHWVEPPAEVFGALPAAPAADPADAAAPAPERERPDAGDDAPAMDRTTRMVHVLWQEMLGVSEVSLDDNLFMLGGDSLLATKLVSRAQKLFDTEIPLDQFLDDPTVSRMAALVGGATDVTDPQDPHKAVDQ
ncbi:acyltransferase domain-containing protein [Streptomyces kaniharaensis]|uniref:Acyltransferase domain-containing protein n=1 Tax=Streptomyces kaniharaensis TaxID=212423 RepID=A0A6N7KVZ0_9ACTN|nr:type I polyketide synthase [Streptomyces kaniharaensis]MQS14935.1 acyltransferase domain-containing protein [Streptomyces kaniharaensis]